VYHGYSNHQLLSMLKRYPFLKRFQIKSAENSISLPHLGLPWGTHEGDARQFPYLLELSAAESSPLTLALQCPNLKILRLVGEMEPSGSSIALTQDSALQEDITVQSILQHLSHLQVLELTFPIFHAARSSALSPLLEFNPFPALFPDSISRCLPNPPGLQELHIHELTSWSFLSLMSYMRQGNLAHLRKFQLTTDLHAPRAFIQYLAQNCPQLKQISLKKLNLAPDHWKDLVQSKLAAQLSDISLKFVTIYIACREETRQSIYQTLLSQLKSGFTHLKAFESYHCSWIALPWVPSIVPEQSRPSRLQSLALLSPKEPSRINLSHEVYAFPELKSVRMNLYGKAHLNQLLQCRSLNSLEVRFDYLDEFAEDPGEPGSQAPTCALQSLNLWAPPARNFMFDRLILPMHRTLATLTLFYPTEGFASLMQRYLESSSITFDQLRTLEVRYVGVNNCVETAQALYRRAPNLNKLHMESFHLATRATLESSIVSDLYRHCPRLKSIQLYGYQFNAQLLSQFSLWKSTLQNLDLRYSELDQFGTVEHDTILRLLNQVRTFQSIQVDIHSFQSYLLKNLELEDLSLSSSSMNSLIKIEVIEDPLTGWDFERRMIDHVQQYRSMVLRQTPWLKDFQMRLIRRA
jgi:hypothetical protein